MHMHLGAIPDGNLTHTNDKPTLAWTTAHPGTRDVPAMCAASPLQTWTTKPKNQVTGLPWVLALFLQSVGTVLSDICRYAQSKAAHRGQLAAPPNRLVQHL
jgi:hypothetical protein